MTVKVYTASSNRSCRKAIDWLEKYEIPYVEKNVSTSPLTTAEIREILSRTDEGTDEIISHKSKIFKKMKIDFDALSLNQLYNVLQEHPGLLRLPIIIDDIRLQVGYNDNDIRQFLPRYLRLGQLQNMLAMEN